MAMSVLLALSLDLDVVAVDVRSTAVSISLPFDFFDRQMESTRVISVCQAYLISVLHSYNDCSPHQSPGSNRWQACGGCAIIRHALSHPAGRVAFRGQRIRR